MLAVATVWACGSERPAPLEPAALDPATLQALEQFGVTGPVALARVRRGGATEVPARPLPPAERDPGPPADPLFRAIAQADADPSALFFITNPAGGQAMENAPNQVTVQFTFFCISDRITQLFDVTVNSLTQEAIDNTGGHRTAHAGEKPVGTWDPDEGQTTSLGTFTTTYTSQITAGDEFMRLDWTAHDAGSDCEGLSTVSVARIGVRFGGLVRVAGTAELFFDVITSDHFDVYFATPRAAARTHNAARNFFAASGARMRLNSGSLVFGGIYDIDNNWAQPHRFHRIGTDMDIDGPADTPTIWEQLILAGQTAGFRLCEVHNRNHVHCYGNDRPYSTF